MATKSENADIAVLQTQMDSVKDALVDIKGDTKNIMLSLEAIPSTYVTKAEFEEYKKGASKSRVLNTIITVLITATLTSLVIFYLSHGHQLQ